jgi:hypothetical protein
MYKFPATWNCGRNARENCAVESRTVAVGRVVRRQQEISLQGASEMVTRLLVAMAFALIGLLAVGSTAHADTVDDKFLAALKSEGITDHVSAAHAIEAGHFVCVKLDNGATPTSVVNDVLNSSNMPAYHSGFFVGASIDAYCPRHKPESPTG